jgi:hypothetical protein
MDFFGIVATLDGRLIILLIIMRAQVLRLEILLDLIGTHKAVSGCLKGLGEEFRTLVTDVTDLRDDMNESLIIKTLEMNFVSDTFLIIMGTKGTKDYFLCSSH